MNGWRIASSRWTALALAGLAGVLLVVTADADGADGRLLFGMWRTRDAATAALLLGLCLGSACAWVSRAALLRYLFLVILAGATLALLELAGLTGLVSYPQIFGNLRLLPSNEIGRRPMPGLDVRGETFQDTATAWGLPHEPIEFHYRTGRHGFRNPSDPGDADVYLLGDSILVAGLVRFEETVTARLERALGKTVMNVALVGIAPQQEHELFFEAGLPIEGRLVLQFLFEGNDLGDSLRHRRGTSNDRSRGPTLRSRSFGQNAVLALQRLTQPVVGLARRRTCEISGRTYTFRWAGDAHRGREQQVEHILSAVERFAAGIESAGGRFGVVFVPTKLRVLGPVCEAWPPESDLRDAYDANPFREAVRRWGRERGIRVIDLTEPLRHAARAGEIPWFWGDTHWNEVGHAVAARTLADEVAQSPW